MSSAAIPFGWVMNADGSYSKPRRGFTTNPTTVEMAKTIAVKKVKAAKRIRQDSKPLMNELESEYWRILCEKYGDPCVKPQALRFKLGNGIWFKPDFAVFVNWIDHANETSCVRMVCYEVKGAHAFRGGFENLKVAAGLWPQIQFILVWKESGQWKEQEILQ